MISVAQVQDIIWLYEREELSQRLIAKRLGISRGTVARVLAQRARYLQVGPKRVERTAPKMTAEVRQFIDEILQADQQVPRKQRHTARLIWQRVLQRLGPEVAPAESTVRRYVGQARQQHPEPFIPLAFPPGDTMQGDFGEALVTIAGERQRAFFWADRLAYSRAVFVMAFPRPNQAAFLEGQRRALEFFGGVPKHHVIDNLRPAIKEGVGKQAVEQDLYRAFQAHYGFRTEACNAHAGHEKGQVENLVGFVQRNWFTGIPEFPSWEALNAYLLQQCELYLKRRHPEDRQRTIGQLLEEERRYLGPLPMEAFACCQSHAVSANKYSLVQFEGNRYSVPTRLRLRPLTLRAYAMEIEIVCQDQVVARHPRCYRRGSWSLDLQHYLEALRRKPRALRHARPFQMAELEPCLRELYTRLREVDPQHANTRWLDVMLLGETFELPVFLAAVQTALQQGRFDVETIRYLCLRPTDTEKPKPLSELSHERADVQVRHESVQRFALLQKGGVSA